MYFGWDRQQWHRAAQYWVASVGPLPGPSVKAGDDVRVHYLTNHRDDPIAGGPLLVDGDGKPLDSVSLSVRSWTSRMLFEAIKEFGLPA
jgi:hypothetical protein